MSEAGAPMLAGIRRSLKPFVPHLAVRPWSAQVLCEALEDNGVIKTIVYRF